MTAERLQNAFEGITDWLDEHGIAKANVVIYRSSSLPVLAWLSQEDGDEDWRPFLTTAHTLGARLIWITPTYAEAPPDPDPDPELLSVATPEELEAVRRFNRDQHALSGSLLALRLLWSHDGILNEWMSFAEEADTNTALNQALQDLTTTLEQRLDQYQRATERRERDLALQPYAERLAVHPEFQACTNREERARVARKVFDTDVPPEDHRTVILHAETLLRTKK